VRRELDPSVAALLAAAQIHRPLDERAAAGRRAAAAYVEGQAGDLWGWDRNGELVGIIGVQRRDDVLWLSEIAVAPHLQRSGVGRGLVEHIRGRYPGLEIAGDTLESGRAFYEACGFTVTEVDTLRSGEPLLRFRWVPDVGGRPD
jgi:N-acetylglutamate synthase-like GNAT family acetyltransferase